MGEITIPLTITGDQLEKIASMVADQLRQRPRAQKDSYTVAEAAEMIRVCPATIRRRVEAGILPKVAGFNVIRIPASHIHHLLCSDGRI